ncbi:MAG: MBL fold metallo-hydrolase [Candidatus Humimicrobiaceae bacterium]
MKLTEHVYMVGSGHFGLSQDFDSSVYVVNCNGSLVMIDTGAGCDIDVILKNIEKDGLDPKNISNILLTHYHADHAGGAKKLKDLYKCKVYISAIEAGVLRKGDEETLKLDIAKRSGLYSPDYIFSSCEASVELEHNDLISCNDFVFKALNVPGHSEGSICYLINLPEGKALFSGDVVFAEGIIGMLNCDGSDLSDYRKYIDRLSNLNVDMLFPGHFVFVLSKGQKHIDKAITSLSLLGLPKNFI